MTSPLAEPRLGTRRSLGFVIAVLMLVAVVSSFELTMLHTALPSLISEFESTESAVFAVVVVLSLGALVTAMLMRTPKAGTATGAGDLVAAMAVGH
ncbi:hypothetical protein [Agromyces sp. Marseille-Q5079]|uniref:hypothetical protein n=1 Tax=Agromyces sp. Marseille-Q5079 TaxID=3439059 RepID=UPI003D9CA1AE